MQSTTVVAAALCALCGACEIASALPEPQKHEVAPVVLFVRQPEALASLSLLVAPARQSDGSEARPFPSLRVALQFAPAGALLEVAEGVWRERLEISRPLVLMGRGPGRTRLLAPERTPVAVLVRGTDHVQLYGISIEDVAIAVSIEGGVDHRLENVELRNLSEAALVARQAEVTLVSCTVADVAGGTKGHAIDVTGGALEARHLTLRRAARRAVVVLGGQALLEDLEVSGSAMAGVQALDGARVRVVRGDFEGQGGAAIYAGAARLSVDGAHLRHGEYGIIVARGTELTAADNEISDYRVAGIAIVNAHGTVQRTAFARGGSESAVSITSADGKVPVLLVDNRIQDPGTMGVHVTNSTVTARGNTLTGARTDRQHDMGDAFYAIDSRLVIEGNVMRGNAGSGVATVRSVVRLSNNGFIENGRAGLLLVDRSRGRADGNLFQRNALAAVEVGEQAKASLVRNRFEGNLRLDIDTGCGKGVTGTADVDADNSFAAPIRRRACLE